MSSQGGGSHVGELRRRLARLRQLPPNCRAAQVPVLWGRTGVKAALRLGEGSYYTEWILAIGGKHHRSSKKIVRAQDAVRPRILTKRIMVGKHNVALGAEEQAGNGRPDRRFQPRVVNEPGRRLQGEISPCVGIGHLRMSTELDWLGARIGKKEALCYI